MATIYGVMKQINVRENVRGNQEWITQRYWQHCVHKIQEEDKTKSQHNRKN
jgi:hypothetical protein